MGILNEGLDKLILLMMLILMKMILKLLFMSDLWLRAIYLNNVEHLKKYKQRINACRMASYKMVRLVYVKRWEKISKTIFN